MKRSLIIMIRTCLLVFIATLVFATELRAQISQIRVTLITSNVSGAGTDADVFIGIGGREFNLNLLGRGDRERNQEDQYVLGEASNVERSEDNDPRSPLPVTVDDIDEFPVYIRMIDIGDSSDPLNFPEDEWIVDFIDVIVFSGDFVVREFLSPRLGFINDEANQRLGPRSGFVLHLRRIFP